MKKLTKLMNKKWMSTVCNCCIALGGFLYMDFVSTLFFGEIPFPTDSEE